MIASPRGTAPVRVLLVEDDQADSDLITHTIKQANVDARVDVAATRQQFSERLASLQYDIVLADYRLPDWTGMKALRKLRHLGFDIPLVIVTGALGDELAVECVKAGAADYVLKDNLARLPMVIKRALDEKRARDEALRARELMQVADLALSENAERFLKLEDQVRQAQKMEAIGRLAGGVAHDFNNLLTVITGFTDMLLGDFAADDRRAADLLEIRKAADAAADLTKQLLAFSRQQVIEPRVIVLEDVVKKSEKLLRRLIGEDVDLATRFSSSPCVLHMDPGQLEQIIVNLVVNARDAMPIGGRLTIETAVVDLDEDYAAAHWPSTTGRYAMLAVSDTGIGMDDETRAKIFEPFFTTKEHGKGTGLGLSTVYGIVKQNGGFIWAYSEPAEGTTFKVYLPLSDEMPTPLPDAHKRTMRPRGTETILLVEDSEAVRNIARRTLEEHGYEVMDPPSATAALELVRALGRQVHLLLTDVVMPQMSGRKLAEELAVIQPGAKVLYMSGYTDDAVIRHGILVGETPFLQKPFTPLALVTRVREVLDS